MHEELPSLIYFYFILYIFLLYLSIDYDTPAIVSCSGWNNLAPCSAIIHAKTDSLTEVTFSNIIIIDQRDIYVYIYLDVLASIQKETHLYSTTRVLKPLK